MMKQYYRIATLMCLVALFAFASCQKEEGRVLFIGTIEQPTVQGKTSVEIEPGTEDAVVKWEPGDEIALYDANGTRYTLEAEPTGNYTTANFLGFETVGEGPYAAIYPAELAVSGSPYDRTCTLPEVQDAASFKAPMHAYSENNYLHFNILCGAIQLNLPQVNKTITSVELNTPNNIIAGEISWRWSPFLGYLGINVGGEGHTVTLDCGEGGMDCSNGLTLYIYLPEGEYSAMTFTINADDGSCAVKSFVDADDPIVIKRSVYYPTTFNSLNFILPAKLIAGTAFYSKIPSRATSVVFEYRSTVCSGQTLSASDSPTPIYGNLNGTVWTVSTPADRIDAHSTSAMMFNGKSRLTRIDFGSGFNTANVKDMSMMFYGCSSLTSVDLSMFNTSNVSQNGSTGMSGMFSNCSSLTSLDLSSFTNGTVMSVEGMFFGCSDLQSITFSPSFASTYEAYMSNMFYGCSSLTSIDLSHFNTANVGSLTGLFRSCSSLTSLNLSSFNTANVVSMDYKFFGCTDLATLTLSSNFTGQNVTNMRCMFSGCSSLTSIDLSHCYTPYLEWTENMFQGCNMLSSLNIAQLDMGEIEDFGAMMMFESAGSSSHHINITCTQATKNVIDGATYGDCFLFTPVTWTIVPPPS
ncbi:MAG: BspA family leucine-rich repeat surface protein [Bacteroidales bacterium]|nr:BspA family leucine-rich repeat surface protein [Bacteroidales bacterium]